jgi:flavorubredoxin
MSVNRKKYSETMSNARVVEIAKNIYWVGGKGQQDGLYCNPYLLVDEEEAVLIDPGSVLDFADVLGKCLKHCTSGKN